MTHALSFIMECDEYLGARTGKYEWRRVRYRAALAAMLQLGLHDTDTVVDVGAGWTEFDYCLRTEGKSRCRYIPVDGCIDGTDLEFWSPPRSAEYFVCLELLEHLQRPERLVEEMQTHCKKAIIVSTPDPFATDVLGMDPTHQTEVSGGMLSDWGFYTEFRSFYGNAFTKMDTDSVFGVWTAPGYKYKPWYANDYETRLGMNDRPSLTKVT